MCLRCPLKTAADYAALPIGWRFACPMVGDLAGAVGPGVGSLLGGGADVIFKDYLESRSARRA